MLIFGLLHCRSLPKQLHYCTVGCTLYAHVVVCRLFCQRIIHCQLVEYLIFHSRHSLVSLLSLESSGNPPHCSLYRAVSPCIGVDLTERLLISCMVWLYHLSVTSTPPRPGMPEPLNTDYHCQPGYSAIISTQWAIELV